MQNIKSDVFAALKRALPGNGKVFFVTPDKDADLPCISYLELNNIPSTDADDDEYTSDIEMSVDIWGDTGPEELSEIMLRVDNELKAIGGRRTYCTDIPQDADHVYHKNMRYDFFK